MLSNDVEINPGPTLYDIIDATATVCANFNQGDKRFGWNAGKQCVAMSLTAIVHSQIENVSTWNSSSMNNILENGNGLYSCISNSVNKSLLLLSDGPEMISAYGNIYTLQYSEPYAGGVLMQRSNDPYLSLEDSLTNIFLWTELNYKYALLTIGINTVAIFKISDVVFKIFDSHSRDLYGIPHPFGKCILLTIESIPNLVTYFQNVSSQREENVEFEIVGVNISLNVSEAKRQTFDKETLQNETPEIREKRLQNKTQELSLREKRLQNETPEIIREKRLSRQREYKRKVRQNDTLEKRAKRLCKDKLRTRESRANETPENKRKRLASNTQYKKRRLANETFDNKEQRLLKNKQNKRKRRENEISEKRERRLSTGKKLQIYSSETSENKAKRLSRKLANKQQGLYNNKPERNLANRRKQRKKNWQKECPATETRSPKRELRSTAHLVATFHEAVSQGPLYICTCDQLWYKHSVCLAERTRLSNPEMVKHLQDTISVDNKEWLCKSCNVHLKKNKVPPCALTNGLQFPVKPDFFDLNELECRLLAPRLAFQKIMQAPRGKQFKINGNVVNVPADVNSTVNMLPRLPHETGTIKVQLKRRLQYKSTALSLNVRPHKVMQAATWLASTSALYQQEGILINQRWNEDYSTHDENLDIETTHWNRNADIQPTTENVDDLKSDDFSEDEADIPAGVTDTMLTAPDFLDDSERQQIYNVAPGEGNTPLSIFCNKYSEELAYPGIFLGQKRPDDKQRITSVHYSDICKSELRRSDRRAAMCVENIFFKTKKLQMKILLGKSQIALRKCMGNNRAITAGDLKNPGGLQQLIHHNEGYKFLRALRGSPPYFKKAKRICSQ